MEEGAEEERGKFAPTKVVMEARFEGETFSFTSLRHCITELSLARAPVKETFCAEPLLHVLTCCL